MIIEMTIEDIEAVMAIEEEVFTSRWTKEQFRYELLENEFSHLYVLKQGDEIIGYAGIWFLFERAEITTIAIKKAYQGQGYGDLLFRYLLEKAKEENSDIILLEVRSSNEVAIKLYEKYGFSPLRVRKGYYQDNQEDAIEMMKIVGE